MRSATHDQHIRFDMLSPKSQQMKYFYHKPTGDMTVDQKRLWVLRMAMNAREPGKHSIDTKSAQPRREVEPQRSDLADQKEPVCSLTLVEGHQEVSVLLSADFTMSVTGEELTALHRLKIAVAGFHNKMILFLDCVAITDFYDARGSLSSLRQLLMQRGNMCSMTTRETTRSD